MTGDSILIVAALNGMRSRAESPAVPYTADEIASEAKRAVDAGAGIVHVHARKEDGSPAFDLVYDEIVGHIRLLTPDVPVSITTQRPRQTSLGTVTALFDFLREPPDLAAVNVSPPATDWPAHREEARQILEALERAQVGPVANVLGMDNLGDIEALYNDSLLTRMPYLVAELGPSVSIGGTTRIPGTPHNVLRMIDACNASLSRFPIVIGGQDEASSVAVAVAAAAGVHVRVGFEDCASLPDGTPAKSNAELVEQAVKQAEVLGRSPMSPKEARALLR
jgi:3-keto-5-aminohexanoate cleavage enzyme